VLKSHGFAIETIFEQDPDDSSGIDELMRILEAFSPSREEMMAKRCDEAARWWFFKGGGGVTTFAPDTPVKVGGKDLYWGRKIGTLKKLDGDALVDADAAIKARLAELRVAGPSGHDAPWPGLEVLKEVDANEKRCDAAARWWFFKGGVGVTKFAPNEKVMVDGKRLDCGPKICVLKKLKGDDLVAADDAIEARLAALRAADSSGHATPWPGLEMLKEYVKDMKAKQYDAAARWWCFKGGVGVTEFAPNAWVPVDGKKMNCGAVIRTLKELDGDDVVAADAAIEARLAVLRAAGPSGHDAPWPGLEVLIEDVKDMTTKEKRYDAAARWWFFKGGVGVTTFLPEGTVQVDGKDLQCGPKICVLKKLKGGALKAADDAIKARLAKLRAAGPSKHAAPWPGLEVLKEDMTEKEKRYDAAARWWISRGDVGVTEFAPNAWVPVDGKRLDCGPKIRVLKHLKGGALAAADAAIEARLDELRAVDPSGHDAPWPGLEVLTVKLRVSM
jgi:hypothetical protein